MTKRYVLVRRKCNKYGGATDSPEIVGIWKERSGALRRAATRIKKFYDWHMRQLPFSHCSAWERETLTKLNVALQREDLDTALDIYYDHRRAAGITLTIVEGELSD